LLTIPEVLGTLLEVSGNRGGAVYWQGQVYFVGQAAQRNRANKSLLYLASAFLIVVGPALALFFPVEIPATSTAVPYIHLPTSFLLTTKRRLKDIHA